MKLQRLIEYLRRVHLRQRLRQLLRPQREHVNKLQPALRLDLVHGDMVILQSKLDNVRWIINTIVEQAASLTDEVRHQLSDEHRLPTANRTQQSNRRRPGKAAPGHLV